MKEEELIKDIMDNHEYIEELKTLKGVSYQDHVVEEMLLEAIKRSKEVSTIADYEETIIISSNDLKKMSSEPNGDYTLHISLDNNTKVNIEKGDCEDVLVFN